MVIRGHIDVLWEWIPDGLQEGLHVFVYLSLGRRGEITGAVVVSLCKEPFRQPSMFSEWVISKCENIVAART